MEAFGDSGLTGLEGFGEGFFVHEADHEYAVSLPVLDDGGDEAVEFGVVEFWDRHKKNP